MGRVRVAQRLRQVFADRLVVGLLAVWFVFSLADLLTTWLGLTRRGGREVVPLYAWLYSDFPFIVGARTKLLVTALIALYCCWQYTRWRTGDYVLLVVGAVVLAVPVIHNLAGLLGIGPR